MLRRTLLAAALTAIPIATPNAHAQAGARQPTTFELVIDGIYTQLEGGDVVFAVSFRDPLTRKVNPSLRVRAGEDVVIHVVNRSDAPHVFEVMSVPGTQSATIPAGGSTTLRFKAPVQGTYIYHDPAQGWSKGARTLFGDFIVTR
jgi:FtsP/CotA-like multicopper oxidase with cupredoxin domain